MNKVEIMEELINRYEQLTFVETETRKLLIERIEKLEKMLKDML